MSYRPKDKIHIPPEWTGEQAKTVWDFLEEIATAVWEIHETGILEAFDTETAARVEPAARGDSNNYPLAEDDIPF